MLGLGLLWAYGSVLAALFQRWRTDPQSSHGFLIPLLAVFLLWQRREQMPADWPKTFNWWGVALLAAAGLFRLLGVHLSFDWLDSMSLVPTVAGLVVLSGAGRRGAGPGRLLFTSFS